MQMIDTKIFNVLFNGDSLEILSNISSESAHLILTDPPYGTNYEDWDKIDFDKFTHRWVGECFRILKDTGTMWAFMGHLNVCKFIEILKQYGVVHLENWVVWARQKGRGSSQHLKSMREDILHITKSDQFTWNPLKMLREVVAPFMKDGKPQGWFLNEKGQRVRWTGLGNVWVYTAPFWKSKVDKAWKHPAQKPFMLIERLLLLSSNEGDIVLDPFAGSGTTGEVCRKHNRNFILIEKELEYCQICEDRLDLLLLPSEFYERKIYI